MSIRQCWFKGDGKYVFLDNFEGFKLWKATQHNAAIVWFSNKQQQKRTTIEIKNYIWLSLLMISGSGLRKYENEEKNRCLKKN
jgi:hypothetical protein